MCIRLTWDQWHLGKFQLRGRSCWLTSFAFLRTSFSKQQEQLYAYPYEDVVMNSYKLHYFLLTNTLTDDEDDNERFCMTANFYNFNKALSKLWKCLNIYIYMYTLHIVLHITEGILSDTFIYFFDPFWLFKLQSHNRSDLAPVTVHIASLSLLHQWSTLQRNLSFKNNAFPLLFPHNAFFCTVHIQAQCKAPQCYKRWFLPFQWRWSVFRQRSY